MKDKIISQISEIISQKEEIVFAYLHGSIIAQEIFDDVDVAVYVKEEKVWHVVDYEIEIALDIERKLKIPVDVKVLNFAPLAFKYHALCGRLLFSRNEDKREKFMCKTWKQYFDFVPFAKRYLQEVISD
jgi:hypothetical protein